jgi:hypothetical protein
MKPIHLLVALSLSAPAFAENFNSVVSSGVIRSTGGSIYSETSFIRGHTAVLSNGYLSVATTGTFGGTITASGVTGNSWLYTPGYLSVTGEGYIGNFLRLGGAANTPAAKSLQVGQYATAGSFNALVVGQYNLNKAKDGTTAPNGTTWTANDPILEVGIGTSTTPKNAFTVYKDGTITMSQAQGDISMGQFGN